MVYTAMFSEPILSSKTKIVDESNTVITSFLITPSQFLSTFTMS